MSARGKFSRGLGWGVIDNFSGTGINFLVGILLARALSPEDFSIIGVSMLLVTISNIISDGGISTALVRKTDSSTSDYNTGFTLNVLTSIVVYGVLFLIAPYLAQGLQIPVLKEVIRWLGIIVIISAFSIIPKAQLTRVIDFRTQALASSASSIIGATMGLTLLYNDYGVWSFVVQQIVRQSLYTLILWSAIQRVPHICFSKNSARNLFSFGSRILLAGLIDALYNNVYFYFLGKTYNGHHLGLYSRSDQFSVGLVANFALVLQRVSLPALTQIKHEKVLFAETFQQLYQKAVLFGLLFSSFIAATSEHFIILLIGEQWAESIVIVKILALSALFQPLIVLYQNVLQVYGKSQLFLNLEIARKVVAVVLLTIGLTTSFTVLLFAFSGIALTSWLLYGYYSTRLIENTHLWQGAKTILLHLLPSSTIYLFVYGVGTLINAHLGALILQAVCFAVLTMVYLSIVSPSFRAKLLCKLQTTSA